MNFKPFTAKKIFFTFSALSFLILSCAKKTENQNQLSVDLENKNHDWFCFYSGKVKQIEKIADSPVVPQKPYTEATRISCIRVAPQIENQIQKAYAVVNQIGFLTFEDDFFILSEDLSLFSGKTAGNLVFYENTPLCGLYKNSFFNHSIKNEESLKSSEFLIQMNPEAKIFYKIINSENLSNDFHTQVTDFIWDGNVFSCALKNSSEEQINFSYISFQPKDSLISITPSTASKKILLSENTKEEFRKQKNFSTLETAPERLKSLIKSVNKKLNFEITLYTNQGHSPKTYVSKPDLQGLSATAIFSETYSAILFQDGTMYLNGFMHNSSQINNGKTCGIKLPKLPSGYSYTGFAISDSTLYASWEQTNFINTGKSGFLKVNLKNALKNANLM